MANLNLQKGDLVLLEIVEHIDDPKKYALMGRFKGERKKHILARIGEGESDVRSVDMIKQTARYMAEEITSLYSTHAMLRAQSKSENNHE